MAIDNHAFCWNGIVTTDPVKAKEFYAETIGWDAVEHEFPSGAVATMFAAGDFPRAHLRGPEGGESSRWSSYLRVEDVDATAAAAANGGSVLQEPTDIEPGRFSVITTPSGVVFCLYHEADEETAANAPAGEGAIHWVELHSDDVDADLAWLKSTFGFEVEQMPMPDGGAYYILNAGGKPRGGLCRSYNEAVAGQWINWVEVPDVDAALARANAHGGKAPEEGQDWPGIGRMAMVTDPTGAVFGMITPAQQ